MTSQHESYAAPHMNKPTVPELVESLGAGPAQIYVLLLGAGGIIFCYGIAFTSLNVISVSVANDMNVGASWTRGLLVTAASIGLMFGSAAGSAADSLGRLRCVTTGYVIIAASSVLVATMRTWSLMVLFCGGIGFGVGCGLGPGIVMMSELTPERWRLTFRVCTAACYIPGTTITALVASFDDPNLEDLVWRRLLVFASANSLVFAFLSALLLPESPVLLAAKSEYSEACHGFQWMAERNGKDHLFIGYQDLPQILHSSVKLGWLERLRVVSSHRYAFALFAGCFADICINFTDKGRQYANPQIFNSAGSALPAAYEIIVTDLPAQILACIVVLMFFEKIARKIGVMVGLGLIVLGSCNLCIAGTQPEPRHWWMEALFQIGLMSLAGGCKMGYAVLYQFAVEIFHPAVSSTGSAIIILTGRLGAALAPIAFETIRARLNWPSFYLLIAVMSTVGILFMSQTPVKIDWGEDSMDCVDGDGEAADLLSKHAGRTYGTAA
mmetsp:Transcript_147730/g.275251  ORF Transcript_147730/g.275251 Transcript_147730/m.275251 type:complete len:497 (-) Transcript_147730:47-1537(-)